MARLKSMLIVLVLSAALPACGTPTEVKTLSTAQIEYFNKIIAAVQLQSKALIIAAETIKQQAEERIEQRATERVKRITNTLATAIPNQPEANRHETALRLVESALAADQNKATVRADMQIKLDAIKSKTRELGAALEQMKEVQQALDAFLQSEQVGERVMREVLGYSGTQKLLDSANSVMKTVSEKTSDITQLLSQLSAMGGAK